MHQEKQRLAAAEVTPPHLGRAPTGKVGLWNRLPVAAKIILTVPVAMALLGAEVELSLAPQLDAILTAAAVWALWTWLGK